MIMGLAGYQVNSQTVTIESCTWTRCRLCCALRDSDLRKRSNCIARKKSPNGLQNNSHNWSSHAWCSHQYCGWFRNSQLLPGLLPLRLFDGYSSLQSASPWCRASRLHRRCTAHFYAMMPSNISRMKLSKSNHKTGRLVSQTTCPNHRTTSQGMLPCCFSKRTSSSTDLLHCHFSSISEKFTLPR